MAAAAESGRINLNGPGGSIILNDGQNWPGSTGTVSTSRRRSSRPSRSANDGLPELARMMRNAAGEDMEEAMVMEAMRLSLLEHEEQQRKQAEEEKKRKKAAAATAASTTAAQGSLSSSDAPAAAAAGSSRGSTSNDLYAGSNAATRSPPPAAQSVLEESATRSPSGVPLSPPRLPATMVDPASLGLSQTTMDELRELIDGGPSPPASSASASSPNGASSSTPTESSGPVRPHRSVPAPAPVPVPQPVAGLGSVLSEQHHSNISSQHGYPSPPLETSAGVTKHATTFSTTSASFDANTSAPGSPSSSGFSASRTRIINPNNPFRRSLGEHH